MDGPEMLTPSREQIARPSAILLDMDGTLTEPLLDFAAIKAEMGIGDRPILEALAGMHDADRRAAEAILHRHEDAAAEHSTLNPGCRELLSLLAARSIPTAVITRNKRSSAEIVMRRHGLSFSVLIAREDAAFKPDPAGLLLACRTLAAEPAEAWMVGDGRFDIQAGLAAGMRTVWIGHGRTRAFDAAPWRTAGDLWEVIGLLEAMSDEDG